MWSHKNIWNNLNGVKKEQIAQVYNRRICDFQCIKLTHEGNWTFYLTFGTEKYLGEYTDCRSKLGEYYSCIRGEDNDVEYEL